MKNINLLPWRELKREQEKKQYTVNLAISAAGGILVVFFMYLYVGNMITLQQERNQRLTNEITTLDKQIKEIEGLKTLREALIARMLIVNNLQSTRVLTVRFFDELIKILPDGVYLTTVKRDGNRITVLGYAESNTNISALMRNIEQNKWIEDPSLTEIKRSKDGKPRVENEFILSFVLKGS